MPNVALFSQIIGKLDKNSFRKLVKDKQTDKYAKGFTRSTYSPFVRFRGYLVTGKLIGYSLK